LSVAAPGGVAAGRAAPPELADPAVVAVRQRYREAEAQEQAARRDALAGLLAARRAEARAGLEDARRRGNVADAAASRDALALFDAAADALDAEGDFTLPPASDVRRRIAALVAGAARDKAALDARHARDMERLRTRYLYRFQQTLRERNLEAPDAETLAAWFEAVPETSERTTPPAAETEPAPDRGPRAETASEPEVLGASGEGGAWQTLGILHAEVSGIEMFDIPVAGLADPLDVEGKNPVFGTAYRYALSPVRVLRDPAGAVFRLRAVPDRRPIEPVTWPAAANDWTLTVRVNPRGAAGSRHAAELQVSLPGTNALPLTARGERAAQPEAASNLVSVRIETAPPGAAVYVDRRLQKEDGRPVRTPCTLRVTPGTRNVILYRKGYAWQQVPDFDAFEGAVLDAALEPRPPDGKTQTGD
ncbi:MAG: PEGA domain-containing protein, partial [Lentisphaerae bacterium]|nr:PEGA domain-containing protein [Lentisphaerota bacterium]